MRDTRYNLIPAALVERRQRTRCVHLWIGGGGAYLALLLVVCIALHFTWGRDIGRVEREAANVAARLQATEVRTAGLRAQLYRHEAAHRANAALIERPDWSILLTLIADSLEGEALLSRLALAPKQMPAGKGGAEGCTVTLVGAAQSPAAVSDRMLALQKLGLFDRVQLIRAQRNPEAKGFATSFEIECLLDPAGRQP